jgi:hypothetical protein
MFAEFDPTGKGSLDVRDLLRLVRLVGRLLLWSGRLRGCCFSGMGGYVRMI